LAKASVCVGKEPLAIASGNLRALGSKESKLPRSEGPALTGGVRLDAITVAAVSAALLLARDDLDLRSASLRMV
jgi:hypothetical protein